MQHASTRRMTRPIKTITNSNIKGKERAYTPTVSSKGKGLLPTRENLRIKSILRSAPQASARATSSQRVSNVPQVVQVGGELSEQGLMNLRKTISLLFLLTQAPPSSVPSTISNQFTSDSRSSSTRLLTFEQEKSLVETFAFISLTNNPLRVTAFCLEETLAVKHKTFTLNIASNHGNFQTLKIGLESIIKTLSSANEHKSKKYERAIQSIVSVASNKILGRLRSHHARWTGTKFSNSKKITEPILPRIINVFEDKTAASRRNPHITADIQTLKALSNSLEQLPRSTSGTLSDAVLTLLVDIVKAVHGLWQMAQFRASFDGNPLSPTVAKVACYVSAARFLVNQFDTHNALKSMRVETVVLEAAILPTYTPKPGGLESFVTSVLPASNAQTLLRRVQREYHGLASTSDPRPDKEFAEIVNATCPVHAEIQLLFHYELYPCPLPPRVILSTNEPCYLCSLFFRLHGKFYIPSSHGRLYEKWTLPEAVRTVSKKRATAIRLLVSRFQDSLISNLSKAAVLTQQRKVSSLESFLRSSVESFFRSSAIWALVRGGSPSVRNVDSRIASRGQSRIPQLKLRSMFSLPRSSHETIKPSQSRSCATSIRTASSQATIKQSKSVTATVTTYGGTSAQRDGSLHQGLRKLTISATSISPAGTMTSSILESASTTATTHYQPQIPRSRHLPKGSSIIVPLPIEPDLQIDRSYNPYHPTTTLVTTKALNMYLTSSPPPLPDPNKPKSQYRPPYALVRNLSTFEINPITATAPTTAAYAPPPRHNSRSRLPLKVSTPPIASRIVDTATLPVGQDVLIDQGDPGAELGSEQQQDSKGSDSRRGFFLRSRNETVFLRCGYGFTGEL